MAIPVAPPQTQPEPGVLSYDSASQATSRDENESDEDSTDPEVLLKQILKPNVYKSLHSRSQGGHQTILNGTMVHYNMKTKTEHDYLQSENLTAGDLLGHYDIIGLPSQGILNRLRRHCPLKCLLGAAAPTVSPMLAHIHALARTHIATNGSPGVSFAGLLQSYLLLHLNGGWKQAIEEASLIGGKNPRQTLHQPNYRINGVECLNRGLHVQLRIVDGSDFVSSGTGPVYSRVVEGLEERLGIQNNNREMVLLYHGTIIESATSIVTEGPTALAGSSQTDFERSFYLTTSLNVALDAAYQRSEGKSVNHPELDPTVLVFPVPRAALQGRSTFHLTDYNDWKKVVIACRRGAGKLEGWRGTDLRRRFVSAKCVVGPISANATNIEVAKEDPRWVSDSPKGDPTLLQYAVKADEEESPMQEIYNALDNTGSVQVIRVLLGSENEWHPEEPQEHRGRRGHRGGRR